MMPCPKSRKVDCIISFAKQESIRVSLSDYNKNLSFNSCPINYSSSRQIYTVGYKSFDEKATQIASPLINSAITVTIRTCAKDLIDRTVNQLIDRTVNQLTGQSINWPLNIHTKVRIHESGWKGDWEFCTESSILYA